MATPFKPTLPPLAGTSSALTRRRWLGLAAATTAGLAGCGGGGGDSSQPSATAAVPPSTSPPATLPPSPPASPPASPPPPPAPAPPPSPSPAATGSLRVGWAKTVNASTTQIISSRADGSDPQVVKTYTGSRIPVAPKWSPDGRQIAFCSALEGDTSEGYAIFVMNADGSNERQVAAGALGSLAWRPDSALLAYCPLSFGQVSLAGFSGLTVRSSTVRVVDTRDSRVVYARGVAPNQPVLSGGPPRYPNGYFHHPVWDGPDALLVNFQNEELTAIESVPPQQPPVYTSIGQKNEPRVLALNLSLPSIGDISPVNELQLPADCRLLARSPVRGALVLWQSGRSKGYAEERLLWVEGSSVITLALNPVVRFDRLFAFTPDGSQCTWDGQLFNTQAVLDLGVGGAPVLASVAGSELSWFIAP